MIREQERLRLERITGWQGVTEGGSEEAGDTLLTSIKEKLRILGEKRRRLKILGDGDDNSFNEKKRVNEEIIAEKNDIRKDLFQEISRYISNKNFLIKRVTISRFATIKGKINIKENEFDIDLK